MAAEADFNMAPTPSHRNEVSIHLYRPPFSFSFQQPSYQSPTQLLLVKTSSCQKASSSRKAMVFLTLRPNRNVTMLRSLSRIFLLGKGSYEPLHSGEKGVHRCAVRMSFDEFVSGVRSAIPKSAASIYPSSSRIRIHTIADVILITSGWNPRGEKRETQAISFVDKTLPYRVWYYGVWYMLMMIEKRSQPATSTWLGWRCGILLRDLQLPKTSWIHTPTN
eukprot:scaffold742_cov165-Amphora_coffeaeformis.AAC.28